MKYALCLRKILGLLLCLFLVEKCCAQPNDAQGCPAGTRCMEEKSCRRSVLKSLTGPPKDCGLTYNRKRRICCPEKRQPTLPTTTTTSEKPSLDCGETNGLQGFVFGGKESQQGAWPWMVQIALRLFSGRFKHICTGAMITSRHVLSAAHCFYRRDPTLYVARIGHVDIRKAYEYGIRRIEIPDSYKRGQFYDDIAVLTLSRDLNMQTICLPKSAEFVDLTGKGTSVAGWGVTTPGGPASDVLMQLDAIEVVPTPICNTLYSSKFLSYRRDFRRGIIDGFLCAGNSSKDTCGGDSGGPMMYLQEDHWYVVGVVSFGVFTTGCGSSDLPGGYTRVSSHLDWIQEKIRN